jgi:hypothetical protein
MLALEPRYLFDAAVVTTVADVTSEPATAPPTVTTAVAADLLVDGQQFAISENSPADADLFETTGGILGDGFIDTQSGVGTLSWSITGGTGETAFSITPDGRLQVLDPDQLDFETTTSFTLIVNAADEFGGEDETTIDVQIGDVSGEVPKINGTVPDQTVQTGDSLTVDIEVLANPTDDDGDPINYALANAPDRASIDPDTGVFTWNPTFDQAGVTTITVLVSNNFDVDQTNSLQFDVTVDPTLISISDAPTIEEGDTLHYTVSLNTPSDPVAPTVDVAAADVAPDALFGVSLNGHSNGNSGASSLYVIDEVTGAGTLIGEISNGDIGYAVNSIAFDPTTGLMYASTTSWSGDFNGLLLIDPSTGAATEIGAFGSEFRSILGLSFNSAGELFGWHDPGADDPVRIDKATGAATTLGPGIGTGGQVLAFDNSDRFMLVQGGSVYEIDTDTGVATLTETLPFNPGSGGGDINNTTGDLWASAANGRTQDSIIRVTDDETDTFTDIDTDVEYLNALAFGGPGSGSAAVTATLAFGEGTTATGGETDDGSNDFETTFYSDPELTNPITSVTLGGSNPTSVDVYVKTFENNPPFNEPDENVEVILTDITNAAEGDTTGDGTISDSSPPPTNINDSTDTGTPESKSSEESGEEGEENGEEEGEENGEEGGEEGGPDALAEGPADPAEEDTQKEAEKFEAEIEALVAEKDFSETTEATAAGKLDAQQPQTRAEEVAEIISIMDKAAALVTQCNVSQTPFL